MNIAPAPWLTKVAEADFPTQFGLFRIFGFEGGPSAGLTRRHMLAAVHIVGTVGYSAGQCAGLLTASENRGHNARTAAAMQHGNHKQRVFVRSIGDQVVAHRYEPQGSQGKVGPLMPLVGKWDKIGNSFINVLAYPVGGIKTVSGDEFPNIVKVGVGFRVKDVAAHD